MPQVKLSHILNEMDKQITSSQNLVTRVKDLGIPRIQIETIAELAFLRLFMSWENFLEESFVRYLVGAKSLSGQEPARFVNPPTMQITLQIISGETREFVKWNSASEVIARSKIYFKDGEPYTTALESITVDLNEMNTVRNRIAHKSKISQQKFNDFIRRTFGHGISGMTPGRFLLTPKNSNQQSTFLDYYGTIIKTTSRIILQ